MKDSDPIKQHMSAFAAYHQKRGEQMKAGRGETVRVWPRDSALYFGVDTEAVDRSVVRECEKIIERNPDLRYEVCYDRDGVKRIASKDENGWVKTVWGDVYQLPDKHRPCIVSVGGTAYRSSWYMGDNGTWTNGDYDGINRPIGFFTHWQYWPRVPKD